MSHIITENPPYFGGESSLFPGSRSESPNNHIVPTVFWCVLFIVVFDESHCLLFIGSWSPYCGGCCAFCISNGIVDIVFLPLSPYRGGSV